MRILVVGAGATGGYFGGRLAEAGRDVTFLVRRTRAQTLRQHGLQIISPCGNVVLRPTLVEAGDLAGHYDVILLTVKAFSLAAAMEDIAPAVGPETAIVPLLNGMRHLARLRERFGAEAVMGGVCKIAATLDAQGRIVHFTPPHQLFYGELDDSRSARLARIDAALRNAGFDACAVPSITTALWEKWILLSSLGGITCLMRGTIGQVAAAPGGEAFARALIEEVASVAEAGGYRRRDEVIAETTALLTQQGSPMTSSLYRDLIAGNAVEADQIIGDLKARADLPVPLISAVWTHLSVYQQNRG
ncbi:2-dehydropantoate 2-reductase [Candidatus Sodalis pierantonius str. SOPE]|uniref:2-dehydropantoate 2-reductase n=1 Tax=Candidatus Sodalis pierantonii str. SOPE TaxID=2342 RepID=W0HLY4_9GAMM|nr:ketopantoate reductase family protein [Candidatus Sodalis pierantonius]AHF74896.1 2-dehydropantoate 2-reductase [Candidatus Sodalis pierantonius str. SOPE]